MKGKILVGGFIIISVVTIIMLRQEKHQHSIVQYIQEDAILPKLSDGDIICRLGNRIWSEFFKELSVNDKRFSHLGIVRIRNNIVSVINAEGSNIKEKDSVNEVSLKDFLKNAQSIGAYRLRTLEGELISDTALGYIGRPFDWHFNLEDENSLYCTELLYVILKNLDTNIELKKVWIKEMGRNIIPLEICSQSEYFIELGYWNKM